MTYLNVDTELGIIGLGGSPHEAEGPKEREGSADLELSAANVDFLKGERITVDGIRVDGLEPDEESQKFPLFGKCSMYIRSDWEFADTVKYKPGTLAWFHIRNAEPRVTVVKDGEVLAENRESYTWIRGISGFLGFAASAPGRILASNWKEQNCAKETHLRTYCYLS